MSLWMDIILMWAGTSEKQTNKQINNHVKNNWIFIMYTDMSVLKKIKQSKTRVL